MQKKIADSAGLALAPSFILTVPTAELWTECLSWELLEESGPQRGRTAHMDGFPNR